MHPHFLATAAVKLLVLVLLWGTPRSAAAQTRLPPPRQGMILVQPSLAQLRPLVGRVVRITLTNGKQIQVRILSAWPGVLRVTFANGRTGAVARHHVRSVTHLGSRFASLATQDAADSGKLFAVLGAGLTLGGLLLGGAAAPALFVAGDRYRCPGILDCVPPATTAAIFVTALSASAIAAGVPLWIVGAVRKQIHGRTGPAATRARRRFRGWGVGLTLSGMAVSAAGGALLAASAAAPDRWKTLRWAGAVVAPLGAFVALCIGLPMWVEAVRKGPADANVPKGQTAPARRVLVDPHHRRAWNVRHSNAPPATTFVYGLQF